MLNVCNTNVSRTQDRDCHCFYACEIIIFYFTYPYQPVVKIITEQPHVRRTLAARRSVTSLYIVMLKLRHHVSHSGIHLHLFLICNEVFSGVFSDANR